MHMLNPKDFRPWLSGATKVDTLPKAVKARLNLVEVSPQLTPGSISADLLAVLRSAARDDAIAANGRYRDRSLTIVLPADPASRMIDGNTWPSRVPPRPGGRPMTMLHREDFARVANQQFDVFVGEATVTMTLIALEPLPTPQGMGREAFSLIFKSASPIVLPQRIYAMRNRDLENAQKVDVFIVPIGRDPDGIRYQAVFN